MTERSRGSKAFLKAVLILFIIVAVILIAMERIVVSTAEPKIAIDADRPSHPFTEAEKKLLSTFDPECAIVLGAGILDSETPSIMLKDRLDMGVMLYKEGLVPKLLLTGDNRRYQHDEIHVMLKYCKDAGIPEKDIFCDHAGFSTYDSMYRAKSIFGVKKAVVVTQKYHLYRAVYLAGGMDIKVIGAASDQQQPYPGQPARDAREVLARIKDFVKEKQHPASTLGGDEIPISGKDGRVSHGE